MDHPDNKVPHAKRSILSFPFSQLGVRYVDYKIQMRMLLALLALELTIMTAGLFYLYYRFSALIDANLYRIHRGTSSDVFSTMLTETGWVIGISLLVNLTALLIADRLWVTYVRSILTTFGSHADQIADLDFRDQQTNLGTKHKALGMIQTWLQGERQRALTIRTVLNTIDINTCDDPQSQKDILTHILTIQNNLPPYSRRFIGRNH